jgi:hypothetical protein
LPLAPSGPRVIPLTLVSNIINLIARSASRLTHQSSIPGRGKGFFFFFQSADTACGTQPASCPVGDDVSSVGVNRLKRSAYHSPLIPR